jgi:hypothetical protein
VLFNWSQREERVRKNPTLADASADGIEKVIRDDSRSNGREQLIAQGLTMDKIAEQLVGIYRFAQRENFSVRKEPPEEPCVE